MSRPLTLLDALGPRARETAPREPRRAPPRPAPSFVWPVPVYQGRRPVITSAFGADRDGGKRKHLGVDVMYPRQPGELPAYQPGTPSGTDEHFIPSNVPAVAVAAGRVKYAAKTRRGYTVIIDHGSLATYYTHLDNLFVPVADDWNGTARIAAGTPLGIIGGDPSQGPKGLKHLHFEVWPGGRRSSAVDPRPVMRTWGHVGLPEALALLDAIRSSAA